MFPNRIAEYVGALIAAVGDQTDHSVKGAVAEEVACFDAVV